MGMLVDGVWQDVWYDTKSTKGHFKRAQSQFRNWVTADGSAGPSGEGGFKAEAGRYHLYVSLACPWAHRTLIFRKLKKLEDLISVSIVDPLMLSKGWEFKNENGGTVDHLFGSDTLWQVYVKADPTYSGRVTVPVLWDKKTGTIVSNESAEIIRMFNTAFDGLTGSNLDFYPEALRGEIDALLAQRIGGTIARFHLAGACHADLNAHNILVAADGGVSLIDFDRGRLRKPHFSWQQANLARLLRSLRKLGAGRLDGFEPRFWHPLLAAYHDAMARRALAGPEPAP